MNTKIFAPSHPHHPEALARASDRLLSTEKAQRMAQFFGLLADANRLRIVALLAQGEFCVGDIAVALEMSESAVSHQLRMLKAMRLVKFRRQGRHIFYQLLDHHVLTLYEAVAEHLDEDASDTSGSGNGAR
ncbi:metalloregulator ArsR/SmtB family transcription factor [Thermosynechococcus sp. JY1334]|uniref:ArsR/SmtB family transcription factor n=1 Tax=unclassified Thermosynechococcus TaxID=2622553 RepID=UPI002672E910|nr:MULTISPECIES: metalloregulator ArsR/SmtB family transcription factor [unclassified Thermosynechococcus]MDR7896744.1 metalloregulator ArsR/SmtB family transcription factor [Thermosynechococcus sp. JY1332]MDR7904141.1 metalloregulator ArsR/SmtB family transcription factor [Thermosynechococcus sp. JY1334]WKT86396.1 metalloregulator ArsR/SmtB family transcription factor [Thermosynechococcus sp. JY1339]WNC55341.1 metalloregulator ArsR/SmtB family transcription factor [Thermosynechococcus sp. JY13